MKTLLLIALLTSLNANADVMGQQQAPQQEVINYVPEGTTVPMLNVVFNCGECEPDIKMKALIEGAYLDRAELEKAKVDENKTNTYTITRFRSRGKARLFVGILAGVDNITGTVECNGNVSEISDTARSAMNGIESVARNVGVDAYKALLTCALDKNNEAEQGAQ